MAYKFQLGAAIMSGALSQEGTINVKDAGTIQIAGTNVVDASRNVSGSTLDGQIQNPATALALADTADLAEGSNLYYTDARVYSAVSAVDAGGDGSFSETNGVFTYTGPSAAEARAHVSATDAGGDGSLAYNSTSGVFTYTGPSAAEARLHLSASSTTSISASYSKATGIMTAMVQSLSEFDTGDVSEGANLYYTDARARGSISMEAERFIAYNDSTGILTMDETLFSGSARGLISATDAGGDGSMAYNASTGVLTYTGPSAAEARAHVSVTDAGGDGSLAYNSTSGVITYTGPSASETRAHFSASMGQTISSSYAAGVFSSNLMASAAGAALGFSSGVLGVNVDDSGIEVASDTIQLKALGVTVAKMANLADGTFLLGNASTRPVAVTMAGDVTMNNAGLVSIGADKVKDIHLDWGTGPEQISTADIPESTNLFYTAERVDDQVSGLLVAGKGITLAYDDDAGSLTITSQAAVAPVAIGDADATLAEGFNFGSVSFTTADRTWTLPSGPTEGDVVHVKAPDDLNGRRLIIATAGSHVIDGNDTVDLESPGAAINMIYAGSNAWLLF